MNNRNFLLFSLISLSITSCSAMETDNNNSELDFCNLRNFQLYFEENRPNFNKIDFKNLTNQALETTSKLHGLLKNIKQNRDTINNLINSELIPTTESIQKILTETSVHGQNSTRAAKLTIPNKKITKKTLRDYEETILEIRLISLQPNDNALAGDSAIFYTSNQNGLEGTILSYDELPQQRKPRVNFFVQLQQLKQEKKDTGAISVNTLQECVVSAQQCLDNPLEIIDETLQKDLKSWITDTKKLISSKQKILPTTKQTKLKPATKTREEIVADSKLINQALQKKEQERLEQEKLEKISAIQQEFNAFLEKVTIIKNDTDEALGKLATFIEKLSSIQKNNPNNDAIEQSIKTAINVLINQSSVSADKKLSIIATYLPENCTIRKNAIQNIVGTSGSLKNKCIFALQTGQRTSIKQAAQDIQILSNHRTEILNALARYQESDKKRELDKKEETPKNNQHNTNIHELQAAQQLLNEKLEKVKLERERAEKEKIKQPTASFSKTPYCVGGITLIAILAMLYKAGKLSVIIEKITSLIPTRLHSAA